MIIGIDLGTTNSLVAVLRNTEAEVIPNALGEQLTPSVVGFDDEGQIIVGRIAMERLITHPEKTTASFKRLMGTSRTIQVGSKQFRPEELSALILRALKADAEAYLGETVTEAIITVPAYFNDTQRKATKIAGELAGLKVERLLNEPTAAALAYGLHKRTEQRYLIFDLGGGTFDISIVEYFDDILEVHASAGDNHLGGNDFTEAIQHWLLKQLVATKVTSKDAIPAQLRERVWKKAEEVKLQLTKQNNANIELVWNEQRYPFTLTETEFETIAEPLLARITNPVRMALRDAKLRVSDLNEIVLVGGATRMPVIRKLVTKLFQRFPAMDIDPDRVVAVGAAIQAALKEKSSVLNDVVMTDVCPYTLGMEISERQGTGYKEGFYLPIIERNSFIPVSRIKTVTTLQDNQKVIEVNVYQGESPLVKDNVFLGSLTVEVPRAPAGEAVDVRFTYDVNGLLEVEVVVVSNQKKSAITIEKNPGVLSAEEIKHRLQELERLKIHPRDQEKNKNLVHRAQRLYQELLGDERQYVGQVLAEFMSVLEKQDEQLIREARTQFEEVLNRFDSAERF